MVTNNKEIPVKIGNLEFVFNPQQTDISQFKQKVGRHSKELSAWLSRFESDEGLEEEQIKELNKLLEECFSTVLGAGAYEKICKVSPSVMDNVIMFTELTKGLTSAVKNNKKRRLRSVRR